MNEYTGNFNLNLSGQISYKDYRNTTLEVYFKSTVVKILLFTVITIIIIFIRFYIAFEDVSPFPMLVIVGVACFMPIYQAKKIYRENKIFHEKLTYHLDNEKFTITGETVNSTQNWSRLFKITETRTFFLLYHDSIIANWLDKKMFSDEEIIEFRKFVNSLDVKKELRKK